MCVPHILLDVWGPGVYLPAVVPAPVAPLGLLISKPEAIVPPACNGTSSYGQSPEYSQTCEASVWCYVTSRQGSDVCRQEPVVGWSSSPGPSSACETHSDFASSAETLSKSENTEKIRCVVFQMEKKHNNTRAQWLWFTFFPRLMTKDVRSQILTRTVLLCFF